MDYDDPTLASHETSSLTSRKLNGNGPAELAKQLLRNTDLPVLDVCRNVGFQSLGSFTTLFRRHTGTTPAAFRREFLSG